MMFIICFNLLKQIIYILKHITHAKCLNNDGIKNYN